MAKKRTHLFQVTLKPDLRRRFLASQEYRVHGNVSAALRAILDKYLPRTPESQAKNGAETANPIAG